MWATGGFWSRGLEALPNELDLLWTSCTRMQVVPRQHRSSTVGMRPLCLMNRIVWMQSMSLTSVVEQIRTYHRQKGFHFARNYILSRHPKQGYARGKTELVRVILLLISSVPWPLPISRPKPLIIVNDQYGNGHYNVANEVTLLLRRQYCFDIARLIMILIIRCSNF